MRFCPAFVRAALVFLLLSGCSVEPVKINANYALSDQWASAAAIERWCLSGRLAYMDLNQSMNATLDWCHADGVDRIQISGLWGMGRTEIVISDDLLTVDDGADVQKYSRRDVDRVFYDRLGVNVPVTSLRYWLLGVPDRKYSFLDLSDGFIQDNWFVRYLAMKDAGGEILPEKIKINRGDVLLKLVIGEWTW